MTQKSKQSRQHSELLETFHSVRTQERGAIERELLLRGLTLAGVDEVGRGCLAGPVFGGACMLDYEKLAALDPDLRSQIRDSKKLSAPVRKRMVEVIQSISLEAHVGMATVQEIETMGIVPATTLAIKRALSQCQRPFDLLLVDGRSPLEGILVKQLPIIKGDDLCHGIAAAAILAKEARDRWMIHEAQLYPEYGFERHVGYGTEHHRKMIDRHGICPLHRKNFAPIREMLT